MSPRIDAGERASLPVLVPDAHAIGMIGVIRSLGRAGYPVHACASDPQALGLASTFATSATVCPPYADAGFLPWLAAFVSERRISAIVPSEGFLLAIRPVFSRYAALLPMPQDPAQVYEAFSKAAIVSRLQSNPVASANLPPSRVVDSELPSVDELEALGPPLFVKVDAVDARQGAGSRIMREATAMGARVRVEELLRDYARVLVQGFVPGQGTGAYFLLAQGEIIQEFANRCLHEVPHTGGFCSLRESWWNDAMMDDARAKIRYLGWDGVAMLEYRWDAASGRFHFIEMNARFWAALHLALYAGVDFPCMLLDAFHGRRPQRTGFPLGLQCRFTVPYDVGYVLSRWRDPALGLPARLASCAGWLARCFDPRIRSDLWFPRDRQLYWRQWQRFLRQASQRGGARPALTASKGPHP